MFVDRRKRDRGANLKWRVRLLGLGALLGLLGIGTEREWLINVALGVLIVGFGLRFLARGEPSAEEEALTREDEPPPGEEPTGRSGGDVEPSTRGGSAGKGGEVGPGTT